MSPSGHAVRHAASDSASRALKNANTMTVFDNQWSIVAYAAVTFVGAIVLGVAGVHARSPSLRAVKSTGRIGRPWFDLEPSCAGQLTAS